MRAGPAGRPGSAHPADAGARLPPGPTPLPILPRPAATFLEIGKKYSSQGVKLLLFPSREFGGQEFENSADVVSFAEGKGFKNGAYGDIFSVGSVTPPGARDPWKALYDATGASPPGWNFKGKFVIDKDGNAVASNDLEADIEKALRG